MDFPEFTINCESQWEFQLIISEILGHHNQKWPRNLHFKFFLSIYLFKELTMLWRSYINITGCVGMTSYWSETIFIISHNIFVKLFETSFGSNIIVSFAGWVSMSRHEVWNSQVTKTRYNSELRERFYRNSSLKLLTWLHKILNWT